MTTQRYTITLSDGTTQVIVPALEVQSGSGALSTPRQIQQVVPGTGGAGQFVLSGDATFPTTGSPSVGTRFQIGDTFQVANPNQPQDPNIGTYTVTAVSANGSPNTTTITVAEDVVDQLGGSPYAPLGQIRYATPAGEKVTSLELAGRGVINYGENLTANMVHMLEHFASDTAPNDPTLGQQWFNTNDEVMYEYKTSGWYASTAALTAQQEPTGMPNRTDTTMTFDDATRTYTITGSGSPPQFNFWVQGVEYLAQPAKSIVISDVEGTHFIYIDTNGDLQETIDFDPQVLFHNNVYLAAIHWDATNKEAVYIGDERHGLTMDGVTHIHFHETMGTQYHSGLQMGGTFVSDGGGASDAEVQIAVSAGQIRDEDIPHNIVELGGSPVTAYDLAQDLNPIAQIPVFYRIGVNGDWRMKDTTGSPAISGDFPFMYSDGVNFTGVTNGLPPYNQFTGGAWQLTELSDNSYVLFHIFATNDVNHPIVSIMGSQEYNNLPNGQDAARAEITTLTGLPFEEFVPLATFLMQARTSYTNTPQVRFRETDTGETYVDWRPTLFGSTIGQSTITDHGNLNGLADDDHPQYMKFLIEDTAPQLGGNLDVNGFDIIGTDNSAGGSPLTLADVNIAAGQNLVGTPGAVNITGGAGNTGYAYAGEINIIGGAGVGSGYGGVVNIVGGDGNGTGSIWAGGGTVVIAGGNASGVYGAGGEVQISSGDSAYLTGSPPGAGTSGANITITASDGINYGDGGEITITSGATGPFGGGIGGPLRLHAGAGLLDGAGGDAHLVGGNTGVGGTAGDSNLTAGAATGAGGTGGWCGIAGGSGGAQGGGVDIRAGQGWGTSSLAGDVVIKGGGAFGASSTAGKITMQAPFVSQVTGIENPVVELVPAGAGGGNKRSPMQLRFFEHGANGSNYVGLVAPDSITGTVGSPLEGPVWTLPQDDPATVVGQRLTTDAAGVLGFAAGKSIDELTQVSGSPLTDVFNTTVNTTAKSGSPAVTAYVQVFVNGILQREGSGNAFTVTGANQITFETDSIPPADADVTIYEL